MYDLRALLKNAMLAAVYAALTIGLAPISYGPLQVRLSECLTLLAFINKKYVPGLVVGCFLANIGSPFGLPDMIIGTLATFLAVYMMRFCSTLFAASLMPVLANGIIIGLEMVYMASLPPDTLLVVAMAYIAGGEFIAVTIIGTLLMKILSHNHRLVRFLSDI